MSGGKCGRCRGRGVIRELRGLGINNCPDCKGTGYKEPKGIKARSGSVPLVPGARCIVCGGRAVQNHHIIKRQRIDRLAGPIAEDAKVDPRGVVPVCIVEGCHDGLEDERIRLDEGQLPVGFWHYVSFFRLTAGLPRYLMERAA